LAANLVNFIDFSARFGRNMTEEVANWQFFCRRCQKVVEKFGNKDFVKSPYRGLLFAASWR
jgi:hypothetical protein